MQITELQQYHLFDTNFTFVGCKMDNNARAHTHKDIEWMNEAKKKEIARKDDAVLDSDNANFVMLNVPENLLLI